MKTVEYFWIARDGCVGSGHPEDAWFYTERPIYDEPTFGWRCAKSGTGWLCGSAHAELAASVANGECKKFRREITITEVKDEQSH